MKKVTDSYITEHIRSAAEQLTPNKAEQIWEEPIEKAVGDEWYLDGLRRPRRGRSYLFKVLSSVAACFAVCLLSLYMFGIRPVATIYLDVNPSIEMQINSREKVVLAKANNQDGEVILDGMELKRTDLDVAMNAVLGSMVRHGYLSEAKNMILLSVDSSNVKRAEDLRARLSKEIQTCLNSMTGAGLVFDQSVEMDDDLEELVSAYNITPGKAAFLKKLTLAYPKLDFGKLAGLSMKELVDYLTDQDVKLEDYVSYTGKLPEKDTKEENDEEEETSEEAQDKAEEEEEKLEDALENAEEEKEEKGQEDTIGADKEPADIGKVDEDDTAKTSGGNKEEQKAETERETKNEPKEEADQDDAGENCGDDDDGASFSSGQDDGENDGGDEEEDD